MNNIEKLQQALGNADFDAFLITGDINRRYATGFPGSAGAALISRGGAWFFTDTRYFEAATAAIPNAEVRQTSREKPYAALINDVCAEHNLRTLAVEDAVLTHREYREFEEKLDAKLADGSDAISALRAVKSADELAAMIRAQELAETAFTSILPLISTNITERELAAELTSAMLRLGAEDKSFDPIIVSGARSSLPHGVPTGAKLGRGMLTIDFGARLDGWCSDTTRTLCLGAPTDEERRVYETVLAAQLAGIAAAKAGVLGSDIHRAAAEVIEKAGYGAYFGHGFGHSLGLEIHEPPNASPTWDKPLPDGAVISAEPGIYLPQRFGVRIEDVIQLTATGSVNITKLPKELMVIDI
ncbi:MAG: Xaa-Pro peptidase family protein [Oscillospiraceae bacterium]|jgi:Xaa-Pro aminopeptidase|nr:Xaa-Pro peptidase family protein [Oscillospiraceae bacterium]